MSCPPGRKFSQDPHCPPALPLAIFSHPINAPLTPFPIKIQNLLLKSTQVKAAAVATSFDYLWQMCSKKSIQLGIEFQHDCVKYLFYASHGRSEIKEEERILSKCRFRQCKSRVEKFFTEPHGEGGGTQLASLVWVFSAMGRNQWAENRSLENTLKYTATKFWISKN